MSDKATNLENFLNQFAKEYFHRERTGNHCVTCGSNKINFSDFEDEISRREFTISHMCQECQDSIFNTEEE